MIPMTAEVEELLRATIGDLSKKVDVLKATISSLARENRTIEAERDALIHENSLLERAFRRSGSASTGSTTIQEAGSS